MHQTETQRAISMGSERSFGLVFTAVLTSVAAWPLLHGQAPRWPAFALACAFLALALLRPLLLKPLNRAWFKFGLLLSRITTPLVMGLVFCSVVVPTGLLMRLSRKDLLGLRFDRDASSYWLKRDTTGPPPDSMRNQF
ncbi:MAG: SxtJ family membrane protein [Hyphomicrobiaceae bacterium]